MSCGCGSTPYADYGYNGLCRQDLPYPQVSHESVPSLIDNLVTALYGGFYDPATGANSGGIIKSVVNGRIVWQVPCDPSNVSYQFPGVPPNPGEGVLCYILRIFGQYVANEVTIDGKANLWNKTLVSPSLTGSISCNSLASTDSLGSPVTLPAASLYGALSINCDSLGRTPTLGSFSQPISAYLLNTSIIGGGSSARLLSSPTLTGASLTAATLVGNSSLSLGTSSITLPANCVGSSQIINGSILSGDLAAGGTAFDSLGSWTIPGASLGGATFASAVSLGGNLTANNATFTSANINGGTITSTSLSADVLVGNSTAATNFSLTGGNFINPTLSGSNFSLSSAFVTGKTDGSSASSGYLGESITTLVGSTLSIGTTPGTSTTVASVSLPAGDWEVFGVLDFTYTTTSNSTATLQGGLNTTAAFGNQDTYFQSVIHPNAAGTETQILPVITQRIVTTGTNVYLVAATGGVTSPNAKGSIRARRVR